MFKYSNRTISFNKPIHKMCPFLRVILLIRDYSTLLIYKIWLAICVGDPIGTKFYTALSLYFLNIARIRHLLIVHKSWCLFRLMHLFEPSTVISTQ